MAKKSFNWFTLVALWIVSYIFCSPNFQQVSGFWDDGNLLYPVVAHAHDLIPNIDYVNGYPGLHSLLLYGISFFTGIDLLTFRIVTWVIVSLGLSCLYFVALDLMGLTFAILVFIWGLFWTFNVFFTLNPAFVVYSIASGCVFYFYYKVRKAELQSRVLSGGVWAIAAFLCGIGLGFKQSALFNVLAFSCLLAWALRPLSKRWLWMGIKATLALLPLLGFVLLRLVSQIEVIPWNGIVLLPWCFAVIFVLTSSAPEKMQISIRDLIKYLAICGMSSLLWTIYYLVNSESPLSVIYEIYVRIPGLIDRDKSPVQPDFLFLIPMGLLILYAVLSKTTLMGKITKSRILAYFTLAAYGVFVVAAAVTALTNPIQFSPWVNNVYWLSGILISVAMLGFLLLSRNQTYAAVKFAFIFISVSSASGYPYVNNVIFSDGLLALTGAFLVWKIFEALNLSKPMRYVRNVATAILITSFCIVGATRKIGLDSLPILTFSKIGYRMHSQPPEFLFTLTGEWLAMNLPPHVTVDGYPNFALSFALANRVVKSKLPNFLGDQNDYDKIVQDLESGQGADYFVVSPTMYPWKHPYWPSPDRILSALSKNYVIDGVIKDDGGGVIQVYKKR